MVYAAHACTREPRMGAGCCIPRRNSVDVAAAEDTQPTKQSPPRGEAVVRERMGMEQMPPDVDKELWGLPSRARITPSLYFGEATKFVHSHGALVRAPVVDADATAMNRFQTARARAGSSAVLTTTSSCSTVGPVSGGASALQCSLGSAGSLPGVRRADGLGAQDARTTSAVSEYGSDNGSGSDDDDDDDDAAAGGKGVAAVSASSGRSLCCRLGDSTRAVSMADIMQTSNMVHVYVRVRRAGGRVRAGVPLEGTVFRVLSMPWLLVEGASAVNMYRVRVPLVYLSTDVRTAPPMVLVQCGRCALRNAREDRPTELVVYRDVAVQHWRRCSRRTIYFCMRGIDTRWATDDEYRATTSAHAVHQQ